MENQMENGAQNNVQTENNKKDWMIPASILVAGILIAGAVIYSTGLKNYQEPAGNNNQVDNSAGTIKIDSVPFLGAENAPITVVEYGDFQCPFCAKFYKEIEVPLLDYVKSGKVKFIFKPLAFLDGGSPAQESHNAVLAIECAKDQNKYYEFHDAIYNIEYAELAKQLAGQLQNSENNGNLTRDLFKKIAGDLRMDQTAFLNCFDSGKYKNVADENYQEAQVLMPQGVGTPAVFVNGQKTELSLNAKREFDFNSFKTILDSIK